MVSRHIKLQILGVGRGEMDMTTASRIKSIFRSFILEPSKEVLYEYYLIKFNII